jgi:hypothetical protein
MSVFLFTKSRWRKIVAAAVVAIIVLVCYVVLLRSCGYSISFYGRPHLSVIPNESTVEVDGLQITITHINVDSSIARIAYAFEWVRPSKSGNTFRFFRSIGYMKVLLWDANGAEVRGATDDPDAPDGVLRVAYILGEFAEGGSGYLHESEIAVPVPENARFLALSLSARATTAKVPIP